MTDAIVDAITRSFSELTREVRNLTDAVKRVGEASEVSNAHLEEMARVMDGAGLILTKAFIDEEGDPFLDGIQFGIVNSPILLPPTGDEEEGSFTLASDVWAQRSYEQKKDDDGSYDTDPVDMKTTVAGWEEKPEADDATFRVEE